MSDGLSIILLLLLVECSSCGGSEVVEEFDLVFELLAGACEPALGLSLIGGPFDFRHDQFLEAEVGHAFLEVDDLATGLNRMITTKLYMSSSSEHLLLPIPNFFQQSVSLLKYSAGMRGRCGTTFLTMDRMSFLWIRYGGGGPILISQIII